MDKFPCPYCKHACRSNSVVCPSCGIDFARWLKSHPGRTIPGWNPDPVPREPVLPGEIDPARLEGLSPSARAAAALAILEAEDRRLHGAGRKDARQAGMILFLMSLVSLAEGVLLDFLGLASSRTPILFGYVGCGLLLVISVMAFRGDRRYAIAGAAFFGLDILVNLFMVSQRGLVAAGLMAVKAFLLLALFRAVRNMD